MDLAIIVLTRSVVWDTTVLRPQGKMASGLHIWFLSSFMDLKTHIILFLLLKYSLQWARRISVVPKQMRVAPCAEFQLWITALFCPSLSGAPRFPSWSLAVDNSRGAVTWLFPPRGHLRQVKTVPQWLPCCLPQPVTDRALQHLESPRHVCPASDLRAVFSQHPASRLYSAVVPSMYVLWRL